MQRLLSELEALKLGCYRSPAIIRVILTGELELLTTICTLGVLQPTDEARLVN